MNYIVFDLEFNQARTKYKTNKDCPFEIIQIGAVKLDENLKKISAFNSLIKPHVYKKLHPFIKNITNITMDKLTNAKSFNEVIKDFLNFIGSEDCVYVVWGTGDMKELFRNIKYFKSNDNLFPKKYINIQHYASKHLNTPRGNSVGLRNAIELLELPINKDFHDAFNDAYYTAKIFKQIYDDSFSIKSYEIDDINNHSKYRLDKPKKKIDFNALIKQFEKMYKRRMTKEEISIIKLSYKMGLTHQFQIEVKEKN